MFVVAFERKEKGRDEKLEDLPGFQDLGGVCVGRRSSAPRTGDEGPGGAGDEDEGEDDDEDEDEDERDEALAEAESRR